MINDLFTNSVAIFLTKDRSPANQVTISDVYPPEVFHVVDKDVRNFKTVYIGAPELLPVSSFSKIL